MPKISLAGFKDPVRRPRYIIWMGVTVLILAAVVVVAVGVTSSRWFCADGCHLVQDDTIIAYSHGSHDKIACISCHIPVNADPVTFMIHKVEAGLGVIPTVRRTYELPLNAESEVALSKVKMPEAICTQCHDLKNRKITPSPGIIIDHEAHSKAGYQCTVCHNRVAHPEDFDLTLPGNAKHENFMTMDACFRCHGLQAGAKAPGACAVCHPKDFKLKPEFHLQKDFYPKGHAEMAKEAYEGVAEAEAEAKDGGEGGEKGEGLADVKSLKTVNNCETCHVKATFCDKCHGMSMPHPAAFKEPTAKNAPDGHPALSKAKATAAKCEFCHHQSKTKFCDNCHHGSKVGVTFDAKVAWHTQHAKVVADKGVAGCLEKCHEKKFCQDCHNKEKPLPSSHKQGAWLHNKITVSVDGKPDTAKATALHVTSYTKQPDACAVCHGDGGPKSAFCTGCHKAEMPHPDNFKKFHSATGKKNPAVCQNCHQFREICSNCHHVGSSDAKPWLGQHGASVTKAGNADSCFAKCHKKAQCNACHAARKALPASHKAGNWLRGSLKQRALHTTNYQQSPESCTYCHGEGGAKSAFCKSCHKLDMPHPDTFGPKVGTEPTADNGGSHAAAGKAGKLSRAVCANCHTTEFCDSCHHKAGYVVGKGVWGVGQVGTVQQHPGVVKKQGTSACFTCHKETYCSYCHVRAAR